MTVHSDTVPSVTDGDDVFPSKFATTHGFVVVLVVNPVPLIVIVVCQSSFTLIEPVTLDMDGAAIPGTTEINRMTMIPGIAFFT
jgi:hypothetical protein